MKTVEQRGMKIAFCLAELQAKAVLYAEKYKAGEISNCVWRTQELAQAAMHYMKSVEAACKRGAR